MASLLKNAKNKRTWYTVLGIRQRSSETNQKILGRNIINTEAEIDVETTKRVESKNKSKGLFFGKTSQIDKTLQKLSKRENIKSITNTDMEGL